MVQTTLPSRQEQENIINNISQEYIEVMYERDYLKNESYSIGAYIFDLLTTIEYDSDDIIDVNGRNEKQHFRNQFLIIFNDYLNIIDNKTLEIDQFKRRLITTLKISILAMRFSQT